MSQFKTTHKTKLKRGRPRIHQSKHRVNSVTIWLNDQELNQITKYMRKHNLTDQMSPFIRKVIMSKVNQLDIFDEMDT